VNPFTKGHTAMILSLKTDAIDATLAQPGIVLIDFWAPWCAPCRYFAPVFEKVSQAHPEVTFGKVNVDEEPALAQDFAIQGIPTLVAFRDGVPLFAQPGVMPEQALEALVTQIKSLDMAEVRKKIDALEADEKASAAAGA
jgi:thioredoxin 1